MKYLITNKEKLSAPVDWPIPVRSEKLGELQILLEGDNLPSVKATFLLHDGYLRDLEKEVMDLEGQQQSVLQALSAGWPLPEYYSGSFSAALVNVKE